MKKKLFVVFLEIKDTKGNLLETIHYYIIAESFQINEGLHFYNSDEKGISVYNVKSFVLSEVEFFTEAEFNKDLTWEIGLDRENRIIA